MRDCGATLDVLLSIKFVVLEIGLKPYCRRTCSAKTRDQYHQEGSSLQFREIDLLQCFGILTLIDLLPYTFAKQSQIPAKDD